MATLHRRPDIDGSRLAMAPSLASWSKATDPDQLRLSRYLEHVVETASPFMVDHVPLALDLRVGLPGGLPLTEQRDLDNYLQPVVAELGHARFDAVFGSKRHQDYSTLAVTPSVPVEPDRGPDLQVTLTGSYARPEWKTQIHYSCAQAERLDPDGAGPIRLTVAYDIGPGRNWTSLWKPTIDGLGPLVGSHPRPAKVLADPRDGRITDLSLHREINVDLGHTVRISFWWESPMGGAE